MSTLPFGQIQVSSDSTISKPAGAAGRRTHRRVDQFAVLLPDVQLKERLRAVRRKREAARNASPVFAVRRIEDSLRGLLEEAELISDFGELRLRRAQSSRRTEQPPEVRWSVREVELEGVWTGDLEVNLALDEFRVHVWNQCWNASGHVAALF